VLFAVLNKSLPEARAAPGQSAHHGSDRHLEDLGDFTVLELADGLEEKDRTLKGCQLLDGVGHYRVTAVKDDVRVVEQNFEERLVQGQLPGIFSQQISGQLPVAGARVLAIAVEGLQVGVPKDPGAKIRTLNVQVEVTVRVSDRALKHIPYGVRIVERAAAIGFQGTLQRLQVPHEVLCFRTRIAQASISTN
jgi:hypothetical protein